MSGSICEDHGQLYLLPNYCCHLKMYGYLSKMSGLDSKSDLGLLVQIASSYLVVFKVEEWPGD